MKKLLEKIGIYDLHFCWCLGLWYYHYWYDGPQHYIKLGFFGIYWTGRPHWDSDCKLPK